MKDAILTKDRSGERGAAMVTVLLFSLLLLAASGGLLLQATSQGANVNDATSERQAYEAAESGIQAAINALRRGTTPSPLKDASRPVTDPTNRLDYAGAVTLGTSNKPDDPSNVARLSRWLRYNYTSSSSSYPDRVVLGPASSYDPQSGMAFSVSVTDPDNPQKIVAVTTSGKIGSDLLAGSSKTFGIPLINEAKIAFEPAVSGTIDVSAREASVKLGTFVITKTGLPTAVTIPNTPFEITVQMTAPIAATIKLRGTISGGSVTASSVGGLKIAFDSPVNSLLGSVIRLPGNAITPNAPNINGGRTDIGSDLGVTISLSQPRRLLIRSVGFGPHGAQKVMEAIVQRDNFDGLIPATVTLVGNLTNGLFRSSSSPSQTVGYSGNDVLSGAKIPPIGTIQGGSGGGLLDGLLNLTGLLCQGCTLNGSPADLSADETPDFLKSASALNTKIMDLKDLAISEGRYYSPGQKPPNFGNNLDGTGITFIDGDGVLTGAGGGILVVTGKLTLSNAFDFNGTIFVVGKDGVSRSGSGTGTLQGNLVVAPYNLADTAAGFLPPKYDITGGAVSNILYNASNLLFGSNNYSTVVVAVGEK